MTRTLARVCVGGNSFRTMEVEIYTIEEAKEFLKGKEWEIGSDVYSAGQRNKKIAWTAKYPDGHFNDQGEWISYTNCIFVECKPTK